MPVCPIRLGDDSYDSVNEASSGGPFHFVFDRGCFDTFDECHEHARFAQDVAAALAGRRYG